MRGLEAVLRGVVDDLRELEAPFALIGGLAIGARVEPRFTRDADVAAACADDAEAEALASKLVRSGYQILVSLENTAVNRLATVRLQPPQARGVEPIVLDLLFASSGIEPETVRDADPVAVFNDLAVPVAQVPHLIAMKVLSERRGRPHDASDLYGLLRVASDAEVARAEELVDLITERGYAHLRNLRQRLERHLRIARSG